MCVSVYVRENVCVYLPPRLSQRVVCVRNVCVVCVCLGLCMFSCVSLGVFVSKSVCASLYVVCVYVFGCVWVCLLLGERAFFLQRVSEHSVWHWVEQ